LGKIHNPVGLAEHAAEAAILNIGENSLAFVHIAVFVKQRLI
jgi:hypothetical protein